MTSKSVSGLHQMELWW